MATFRSIARWRCKHTDEDNPSTSYTTQPASFHNVCHSPCCLQSAAATGGAYGILEGRTAALVHPAMNFFLLGSSLYAAYLGWQWRRTREIGEEIRALRASAPAATADGPAPPNPALEEKEKVSGTSCHHGGCVMVRWMGWGMSGDMIGCGCT